MDIIDSSGNHAFAGIPGGLVDSSSGISAVFQVQAALFQQMHSIVVSMANLIPSLVGAADPLAPQIWNGSSWVSYPQGFDPTKKTLLLVHGIFSNVSSAYPCAAAIMVAGGYEQVVGFNYDWTQAASTNGSSLANFLNTLQTAGLSQIDIEAHSYGGLTVLSGASQSTLQINNVILEGSPISGTPAAGLAQSGIVPWATTFFNMPMVGNVFPSTVKTLNDISNGAFLSSLLAGVTSQIPQYLTNHPETEFIRVVGTDSSMTPLFLNTLVFNGTPNDGVVGATSLSAPSLPGPQTMSFPLKHTELECDSNVIQAVGAALTNDNVTGTWNGTLNQPGNPSYSGCPAQSLSFSLTLNEDANHNITGSTSNDRTITSGIRVGDTITVTLSTLFGSRGPYKWIWDGANTITGSMAYFCYDLTTGDLNSESIETFSVSR
jgi:pimeloyl-ACP methyl ester carboxylesterase